MSDVKLFYSHRNSQVGVLSPEREREREGKQL
jgi:hypothetical protein